MLHGSRGRHIKPDWPGLTTKYVTIHGGFCKFVWFALKCNKWIHCPETTSIKKALWWTGNAGWKVNITGRFQYGSGPRCSASSACVERQLGMTWYAKWRLKQVLFENGKGPCQP
jgi:hypothetical protein